jgi:hypothetical protein
MINKTEIRIVINEQKRFEIDNKLKKCQISQYLCAMALIDIF